MEKSPDNLHTDTKLLSFLTTSLLGIYRTKKYLINQLPKVAAQATLGELKLLIIEIGNDLAEQIIRLDKMFLLLGCAGSLKNEAKVVSLIESAFRFSIPQNNNQLINDSIIMFYLANIASMDMASFRMLLTAADKLGLDEVRQLLTECFDDVNDNRLLMEPIFKKYLVTHNP